MFKKNLKSFFKEAKGVRKFYIIISFFVAAQSILVLTSAVAMAEPTLTSYSLSSGNHRPVDTVGVGGDIWFLYSDINTGYSDQMGRVMESGSISTYSLGQPAGTTNVTKRNQLVADTNGGLWFAGEGSSGAFLGRFDISTQNISYYGLGYENSMGRITIGDDGKVYYTAKDRGSGVTSLRSLDPATSTYALVADYDRYAQISSITSGPDGRIYVFDAYYELFRVHSISGGSGAAFYVPDPVSAVVSGKDNNLWFIMSGKIVKMTTDGVRTEYNPPAGMNAGRLAANPDGSIWVLGYTVSSPTSSYIGRIASDGSIATYAVAGTNASFGGATFAPDGSLWFGQREGTGVRMVRFGY